MWITIGSNISLGQNQIPIGCPVFGYIKKMTLIIFHLEFVLLKWSEIISEYRIQDNTRYSVTLWLRKLSYQAGRPMPLPSVPNGLRVCPSGLTSRSHSWWNVQWWRARHDARSSCIRVCDTRHSHSGPVSCKASPKSAERKRAFRDLETRD